jgi:adenylate cyclase
VEAREHEATERDGNRPDDVDFAAEGLLDGLSGGERDARLDLLRRLYESGVSLDELRRAVEEERLALLPVERLLAAGDCRYTEADIAKRSGVPLEFLREDYRALGLPLAEPGERAFSDDDLEAARQLRLLLDSGLDEDGVLEVARVVGDGMARAAEAIGSVVGRSLLRPGDTELDLGRRYAEAARSLTGVAAGQFEYVFKLHLRDFIRNEVVGRAELETGEFPGSETITVCFADLVGFTKLGEQLPPDELGRVAGRLAKMAADVVSPPVKLVKTIGDAAMLVSPESPPMLDAAINLVSLANEAGEDFPQLRSGVARGEAVGRGGDWYGRPVNVASRVTAIARPGSVLATDSVHEDAADRYMWSPAGRRRLKGVAHPVPLFRARTKDE